MRLEDPDDQFKRGGQEEASSRKFKVGFQIFVKGAFCSLSLFFWEM